MRLKLKVVQAIDGELFLLYRFMEAVQGKELERIFREEGVIDEDDDDTAGKLNLDVTQPAPSSKDG